MRVRGVPAWKIGNAYLTRRAGMYVQVTDG
jgi:hypothetical protein